MMGLGDGEVCALYLQLYSGLLINRVGGEAAKNTRAGWVMKILTQ